MRGAGGTRLSQQLLNSPPESRVPPLQRAAHARPVSSIKHCRYRLLNVGYNVNSVREGIDQHSKAIDLLAVDLLADAKPHSTYNGEFKA